MQSYMNKPVSELENSIRKIVENNHETDKPFVYTGENSSKIFESSANLTKLCIKGGVFFNLYVAEFIWVCYNEAEL